jgi:DNA-binding winged helix-turn-helix (wHTH) protein
VAVRFEDFTLDSETRRLLRDGEELRVSPKALDFLLVLVTNRARAMSKSELHAHLWPDTFVLESNLASLAAEIRRALEDSAREPRYLRTVSRFGYWFIGAVADDAGSHVESHQATCWVILEARQIALQNGEHVIGRAPDASIWLDTPGVSRRHARLSLNGSNVMLEDLGSKNGTFVRDRRVTAPLPLKDGDQIRCATVLLTVRIPARAVPAETV